MPLINTLSETENLIYVIDMAVAKLMASIELRHKIVLDEFVLSDVLFDSIYQMCYQELVPHLQ